MERTAYTVSLKLDSYISDPYWPELDTVINIQKKSGCNRAKSEGKKELALKSYLAQEGITTEEYAALVERSQQKWYFNADGWIVVPRHHMAGCLANAVDVAPAAVRGKFNRDSFRHHVRLTDFTTDRKERDCLFDRYVKNDATNQRRRTISEVVENSTAVGTVEIDAAFKVSDFKNLLNFALTETGLGSCRKMGYGRGTVLSVSELG